MKKLLCLLLSLCICVSFAACGQPAAEETDPGTVTVDSVSTPEADADVPAEETPAEDAVPTDSAAPAGQPQLPDGLTQLPMQLGEAYTCEVVSGSFSMSVRDYTVAPSDRSGYEVRTVTLLLGSFNGTDPYVEYVFFDLGENINPMFESGVIFRDGEPLDFTLLSWETREISYDPAHMLLQQTLTVEVPAGYEHIALVPMNFKTVSSSEGFASLVNSDSLWFLLGTPTAEGIFCGGSPLVTAAATADTAQLYSFADTLTAQPDIDMSGDGAYGVQQETVSMPEGRWLELNMERSMMDKARGDAYGALVGVRLLDDSNPAAAVFCIVIEHRGLPAGAEVRVFVNDSWEEFPIYEDVVAPGDGTTDIYCTIDLTTAVLPLAFNAHICGPGIPNDIPLCGVVESLY